MDFNLNTFRKSILVCGVGGQGTVLASKLISAAALLKGLKVRSAETIGMAQRGGCVVSHVRIGANNYSPLIPYGQADVLIGFEPAEAVRCLPFLKKNGTVIVSNRIVQPTTASLHGKSFESDTMLQCLAEKADSLIVLDTDKLCQKIGSSKVVNTLLLGAAANTGEIGFSMSDIEQAVQMTVKEKYVNMNLKALKLGAERKE